MLRHAYTGVDMCRLRYVRDQTVDYNEKYYTRRVCGDVCVLYLSQ